MAKAKDIKNIEKVEEPKEAEKDVKDGVEEKKAPKMLEREKRERVNGCSKEIIEVLKKYNCDFDVTMTLRQGSIIPNIQIITK